MKQSDVDALAERRVKMVKRFGLWLWLVVLPALSLVLYFCVFAPNYHPEHVEPAQTPTYNCQAEAKSLANIDAGGQIAPLCGATPYPADTSGDAG